MNRLPLKNTPALSAAHLLFISAAYIYFISAFLPESVILIGDNIAYHRVNFEYFASSVRDGFGFPQWYYRHGGIPVSINYISMSPLMPHRLFGYAVSAALPALPLAEVHKISMIAGMLLMGAGWWAFLFRFAGSRAAATLGTLMVLLGGTGLTVMHQEQVLFTVTIIPWALLTLLKVKEDARFLPLLAVFAGISMTVHYPHIHLLTMIFLSAALLAAGKISLADLKNAFARKMIVLASAAVFVISLLPAAYGFHEKDDFTSPARATEGLGASTYDEYIKLNLKHHSSAPFDYIKSYAGERTASDYDGFALYVTAIGLGFGIIGAAARFKKGAPALIVLFFSIWAALGINAYFAQALFLAKFPLMKFFRQWYHFVPVANLSLSALGALGFGAVCGVAEKKFEGDAARRVFSVLFLAVVAAAMLGEAAGFRDFYKRTFYRVKSLTESATLSKQVIFFSGPAGDKAQEVPPLTVYKEVETFRSSCPQVEFQPFSTVNVSRAGKDLLKGYCYSRFNETSVIADLPAEVMREYRITRTEDASAANGVRNRVFPESSFLVTPSGAELVAENGAPSLVVFPFAYKNGLKAYVNGNRTQTYPAYYGAMTAVAAPAGPFRIELKLPFSVFYILLAMQAAALVSAAGYAYAASRRTNKGV